MGKKYLSNLTILYAFFPYWDRKRQNNACSYKHRRFLAAKLRTYTYVVLVPQTCVSGQSLVVPRFMEAYVTKEFTQVCAVLFNKKVRSIVCRTDFNHEMEKDLATECYFKCSCHHATTAPGLVCSGFLTRRRPLCLL